MKVLKGSRAEIDKSEIRPENIVATATSAVRNATKQSLPIGFSTKTAIEIQYSGTKQAALDLRGVRCRYKTIADYRHGGSVEFIIANKAGILWKQSFEIADNASWS
jgi:hypothetical protein